MQEMVKTENQILEARESNIFEEINSLMSGLIRREADLDLGWVRLGVLLNEVSEQEMWREKGYKSFDAYLKEVCDKYHRGRTQTYFYFSSVREMKPYLSETQMNTMGISKLNVLKKATKELGFPPNNEVIQTALDPESTVSDVRKKVAQEHKLTPEEQTGTWFDLGGFMVSEEEKMVLESAFEATWKTDPVIQKSVKKEIRIKEGLLRMAMEYLAAHADLVEEGLD
jgi:hypothetical protein